MHSYKLTFSTLTLAAVALLGAGHARAQRACLSQGPAGTTYLCDSLEGSALPTTDVVGGTFLADGWRVDSYQNRLMFDLGAPMISGTLRFYFRGVSESTLHEVGTGTAVHRHLLEVYDDGGPITVGGSAYSMKIRTWGDSATDQPDNFGKLRLSMTSFWEAMVEDCGGEDWFSNVRIASSWSGDWIRVDIAFGNGNAEITFTEESTANSWTGSAAYANCAPGTAVLRYVYLPIYPINNTSLVDSVRNSVYSFVSFVGTPATCYDPCDDGNPCTEGQYGDAQFSHYCEAGQCTADPVPDNTPCGNGGICIGGVCDEGNEPDAGAQDAGAQDAGAQDAGAQDAGAQDAASGQDAAADAGSGHGTTSDGCSCRASSPGSAGGLLIPCLGILLLRLRRRRARTSREVT